MRLPTALILALALPVTAADISQLSWLSGCWSYDGQPGGSGEYWMPPAGRTMLAVSRTVQEGRPAGFEFLRISESGDQSLALFASPSGQSPTRFDMLSLSSREVVFENLEHDFPQRIIYRLGEEGSLLGRIEGVSDGEIATIDFPMTAVDCEKFGL